MERSRAEESSEMRHGASGQSGAVERVCVRAMEAGRNNAVMFPLSGGPAVRFEHHRTAAGWALQGVRGRGRRRGSLCPSEPAG